MVRYILTDIKPLDISAICMNNLDSAVYSRGLGIISDRYADYVSYW